MLLPAYRGQGIGVEFFEAREAHALTRRRRIRHVLRGAAPRQNHPLRPAGAVPLDEFWRNRGFVHYPDLACTMRWKQVDSAERVESWLAFWIKSLRGAALP